ncbi:hypothetical protein ATCR1_15036 [Agrobacterium tumefaciens CCNWGS0286]|uniref:hypothetical protein n=1 Tax=Agrobacterium tumefaciens TaxID=358 RepID=UPI000233464F|nr:hypothetical protein [Agrobacterium tumefaciens]EHH05456.1 hypothetical protein ATCR1_15036 [Agrobacterium tumefaciens CCNWGS0286]
MPLIIDFDNDDWMSDLDVALGDLVSLGTKTNLRTQDFEYKEEALDALEEATDIEGVIDATLNWISNNHVRIFHGTRLTDDEAERLRTTGMRPLAVADRVEWLRAVIPELGDVLTDEFVRDSISKGSLQYREGQVHAAISLKELTGGYDYLFLGSEFDRRLLEYAGRGDLVPLLTTRGKPRVIKIVIPGDEALDAIHPFFPIEFTRKNDRYPNLVRDLLKEYAWMLSKPHYRRVGVDSCLLFKRPIPGHQIEAVMTVEESGGV